MPNPDLDIPQVPADGGVLRQIDERRQRLSYRLSTGMCVAPAGSRLDYVERCTRERGELFELATWLGELHARIEEAMAGKGGCNE